MTSAPYCSATCPISLLSVDTKVRPTRLEFRECRIVWAIRDSPMIGRVFLPGSPLEPPRAGIMEMMSVKLFPPHCFLASTYKLMTGRLSKATPLMLGTEDCL